MTVSFIIPVYNEGPHLKDFFKLILNMKFGFETEFVIVDDHSTDNSWEIIQTIAESSPVKIFRQDKNQGKGAAIRRGIEQATGDIILIQDADFEYDPNDLDSLVKPILENRADVVFGSRFRKTSPQIHRTFHYLINRFLTLVSNMLSGLYLSDMETCYKVFRADVIKPLIKGFEADRFGFEPEVTAAVAKLKLRVHEYPISYFPRGYLEGKKINWKDGVAALWFIIKFNLRSLPPKVKDSIPPKYQLSGEGRLL